MLLVSTVQAIVRQDPGQLVRTFLVRLPLALLLGVAAIQIVIMGLSVTDEMSAAVAGGTGADVTSLLSGVTKGLVGAAADPTIASFVLLLIALLIAVAAFVLWIELLIRAAAVYVAALFLPLALATLVWPAISHWCRRLVETLAALIVSKFVIVAVLSLAAGAVSSGTAGSGSHGSGISAILAGGALLLMATFTPFAILRLIPAVEAGAVGHLEGLRQRGVGAATQMPRTAASHALHEGLGALGDARLMAQTPGVGAAAGAIGAGRSAGAARGRAGSGRSARGENGKAGGAEGGGDSIDDLLAKVTPENGGLVSGPDGGLAVGNPESQKIYDDAIARGAVPPPKGPEPILRLDEGDDGASANGASANGDRSEGGGSGGGGGPAALPPRGVPISGRAVAEASPVPPPDDWKTEGVPPGYRLTDPVEPGKIRHCLGDDGHGPQIKWLPAVWPPGEGPDA
jgi:hypothetical protein